MIPEKIFRVKIGARFLVETLFAESEIKSPIHASFRSESKQNSTMKHEIRWVCTEHFVAKLINLTRR